MGDIPLWLGWDGGGNEFVYYMTNGFALVYFICLILAFSNRRTQPSVVVLPPVEDVQDEHLYFKYVLVVRTSLCRGCGCKSGARVFVQLKGQKATSQFYSIKLFSLERFLFQRGSVDILLIKTREYLGAVEGVKFIFTEIENLKWRATEIEVICLTDRVRYSVGYTLFNTDCTWGVPEGIFHPCLATQQSSCDLIWRRIALYHHWISPSSHVLRYGRYTAAVNLILLSFFLTFIIVTSLIGYIIVHDVDDIIKTGSVVIATGLVIVFLLILSLDLLFRNMKSGKLRKIDSLFVSKEQRYAMLRIRPKNSNSSTSLDRTQLTKSLPCIKSLYSRVMHVNDVIQNESAECVSIAMDDSDNTDRNHSVISIDIPTYQQEISQESGSVDVKSYTEDSVDNIDKADSNPSVISIDIPTYQQVISQERGSVDVKSLTEHSAIDDTANADSHPSLVSIDTPTYRQDISHESSFVDVQSLTGHSELPVDDSDKLRFSFTDEMLSRHKLSQRTKAGAAQRQRLLELYHFAKWLVGEVVQAVGEVKQSVLLTGDLGSSHDKVLLWYNELHHQTAKHVEYKIQKHEMETEQSSALKSKFTTACLRDLIAVIVKGYLQADVIALAKQEEITLSVMHQIDNFVNYYCKDFFISVNRKTDEDKSSKTKEGSSENLSRKTYEEKSSKTKEGSSANLSRFTSEFEESEGSLQFASVYSMISFAKPHDVPSCDRTGKEVISGDHGDGIYEEDVNTLGNDDTDSSNMIEFESCIAFREIEVSLTTDSDSNNQDSPVSISENMTTIEVTMETQSAVFQSANNVGSPEIDLLPEETLDILPHTANKDDLYEIPSDNDQDMTFEPQCADSQSSFSHWQTSPIEVYVESSGSTVQNDIIDMTVYEESSSSQNTTESDQPVREKGYDTTLPMNASDVVQSEFKPGLCCVNVSVSEPEIHYYIENSSTDSSELSVVSEVDNEDVTQLRKLFTAEVLKLIYMTHNTGLTVPDIEKQVTECADRLKDRSDLPCELTENLAIFSLCNQIVNQAKQELWTEYQDPVFVYTESLVKQTMLTFIQNRMDSQHVKDVMATLCKHWQKRGFHRNVSSQKRLAQALLVEYIENHRKMQIGCKPLTRIMILHRLELQLSGLVAECATFVINHLWLCTEVNGQMTLEETITWINAIVDLGIRGLLDCLPKAVEKTILEELLTQTASNLAQDIIRSAMYELKSEKQFCQSDVVCIDNEDLQDLIQELRPIKGYLKYVSLSEYLQSNMTIEYDYLERHKHKHTNYAVNTLQNVVDANFIRDEEFVDNTLSKKMLYQLEWYIMREHTKKIPGFLKGPIMFVLVCLTLLGLVYASLTGSYLTIKQIQEWVASLLCCLVVYGLVLEPISALIIGALVECRRSRVDDQKTI